MLQSEEISQSAMNTNELHCAEVSQGSSLPLVKPEVILNDVRHFSLFRVVVVGIGRLGAKDASGDVLRNVLL